MSTFYYFLLQNISQTKVLCGNHIHGTAIQKNNEKNKTDRNSGSEALEKLFVYVIS